MSLQNLMQRGCQFLGCEQAILGGAMSWVSEANLVSAISNGGGFGVLACGSMSPELLKNEIAKTKSLTKKNFGVNLITMHPQINELIEVCIVQEVKYIVLAGGMPKASTIKYIKSHNIKVLCFAPLLIVAKKLLRSGCDALIVEGMEAGGHIGPVSTSVLAQEILPQITEVPVFVAGGIASGSMIATYLLQGAAGCQLGTRFVCAYESIAHPNFKQIFIKSSARDAVSSIQVDQDFPIIPVRAITNKASDDFIKFQHQTINQFRNNELSKEEAQLKIEHFWAGALRKAVIDGDIENGSLMAGQSVGMVNAEQSAATIITELAEEANNFLAGINFNYQVAKRPS